MTGILASETGTSVTLLAQEGKSATVLRNQIDELRSTGKSLMPEGLTAGLSDPELADLFRYLFELGK